MSDLDKDRPKHGFFNKKSASNVSEEKQLQGQAQEENDTPPSVSFSSMFRCSSSILGMNAPNSYNTVVASPPNLNLS